jgi:hypothetical protein
VSAENYRQMWKEAVEEREGIVALITARAEKAEAEVERLRAALTEWRRAESLVDCKACAVLDAALRGGE